MEQRIKDLHHKYYSSTIDDKDINTLRKSILESSDEELEQLLLESWNEEFDSVMDDNKKEKLLTDIEKTIYPQVNANKNHTFIHSIKRCYKYAAMFLFPFVIATIAYMFFQQKNIICKDIIVETGESQKVSVTLSDNTKVIINENSCLRYNPQQFTKKNRIVKLSGEAYFDVHKDAAAPFYIHTNDLDLRVLGTKFNFQDIKSNQYIKVALIEGKVMLESNPSNKTKIITPGKEVTYNKNNGTFSVQKCSYIKNKMAWMVGALKFHKEPLHSVIKQLEEYYYKKVKIKKLEYHLNDSFTGSLPIDDFNEATNIIEYSLK